MAALASTEYDEVLDSAEEGDDRRKRGIIAAVALLVLLLLIIWWIFSRYTPVPDVVGLTVPNATERIESAGFVVGEVLERTSIEGRAGDVIDQSPEGGSRALRGSAVDLFVADGVPGDSDDDSARPEREVDFSWADPTTGPRPIEPARPTDRRSRVPGVLGMTEASGASELRNAGYRVTIDYGPSSTAVRRGYIFYQDPAPDTVAPRGTTVSVFVSTGSPIPGAAVLIPDQPRH